MAQQAKERWSSRLGIILAVSGSAVGIGNFLRFPGLAAQNGGGAFMIPYFLTLLLVAVPIGWAEWTMGRFGGQLGFNSSPAIFGAIGRNRFWRYVGVLGLLIPVCVFMYYIHIEAWCLSYAWLYLTGGMDAVMGNDPGLYSQKSEAFFNRVTGTAADGEALNSLVSLENGGAMLFWLVVFLLNFVIVYRGLSRGIEWFCSWTMPIMVLCSLIVLARVLTLGTPDPSKPEQNLLNGLAFMWNPRSPNPDEPWWYALKNPDIWLAAGGQVFFTLGVGFGIVMNYASYLRRRDDVVLSSLTSTATNEILEVSVAGFITIPAAFIFLGATVITSSTYGMGFVVLPAVFEHMPPIWGIPSVRLIGFVWFFMLFLAAILSSLSMLQPVIAFLEEALGVGRRASSAILAFVTGAGSLFVAYFSRNGAAVETIDFWVGTAMIYALALMQAILFGWVIGPRRGIAMASEGAAIKLPPGFGLVIRYVSPLFLGSIFIVWLTFNLPKYWRQVMDGGVPLYSMLLIGAVLAFFCVLTAIGSQRWNAEARGHEAFAELKPERIGGKG